MTLETGFYIGADPIGLGAAEQWLGGSLDFVSMSTGKANWSDWLSSISWSINKMAATNAQAHWTIPMFANGGSLADAAAHDYDSQYVAAAKLLAATATGDQKIVVRIGEEFNGTWMQWSAAGHEAEYAQAYRNMVDAFRSVSDKFEFVWNVNVGSKGTDAAAAYPGDAYANYIGGDLYWDSQQSWSIADPNSAFKYYQTTSYGLDWLTQFAAQHGKTVSIDEWGVNSNNASAFIQDFYNWATTHNVAWESYWDSNSSFSGMVSNDQYPTISALFKSLFPGNSATGIATAASSATPILLSVANGTLLGTDAADIMTGMMGNNIIGGGGGGDTITVGDGNNHIYGNLPTAVAGSTDGDDVIIAGAGSNYINGNAGNDTITVGTSGSIGVNRVQGGQGNDTISIHGAGMNSVNGNLGNDTITAADATGNNLLRGGQGNDLIIAGQGHDTLLGDMGDDTLRAGNGTGHITIMTGGGGADIFDFSAAGAATHVMINGAAFYQEITDFTAGTDHIAIGHTVALADLMGQGAGSFATAADAETYAAHLLSSDATGVAALQVGGDTFLLWSNSGGAIDSEVKLDGVTASALHITDFV